MANREITWIVLYEPVSFVLYRRFIVIVSLGNVNEASVDRKNTNQIENVRTQQLVIWFRLLLFTSIQISSVGRFERLPKGSDKA